jgi:hypothetical protein
MSDLFIWIYSNGGGVKFVKHFNGNLCHRKACCESGCRDVMKSLAAEARDVTCGHWELWGDLDLSHRPQTHTHTHTHKHTHTNTNTHTNTHTHKHKHTHTSKRYRFWGVPFESWRGYRLPWVEHITSNGVIWCRTLPFLSHYLRHRMSHMTARNRRIQHRKRPNKKCWNGNLTVSVLEALYDVAIIVMTLIFDIISQWMCVIEMHLSGNGSEIVQLLHFHCFPYIFILGWSCKGRITSYLLACLSLNPRKYVKYLTSLNEI